MIEPAAFPALAKSDFRVTSPATPNYNCIAWAAGETDCWWWPDPAHLYYWPRNAPRQRTIFAFVAAFATFGYAECAGDHVEAGYEKLAIYVLDALPTHVARQLSNGRWTSKLGPQEDIEHELKDLAGPCYGEVVVLLRRPKK